MCKFISLDSTKIAHLAPNPRDAAYNPATDATITNSFAHAVFRIGHSQVNETTLLVNNFGQVVDELAVRDAFFNPDFLKDDPANVGRMLKELASQLGQENDLLLVDGIRNSLQILDLRFGQRPRHGRSNT